MVSTVGTPQTAAAQELRVKCMFPKDDLVAAGHCSASTADLRAVTDELHKGLGRGRARHQTTLQDLKKQIMHCSPANCVLLNDVVDKFHWICLS